MTICNEFGLLLAEDWQRRACCEPGSCVSFAAAPDDTNEALAADLGALEGW